MKTIQQRILAGIEAIKATEEENVILVIEYDDYLDCGCLDWMTLYPNDDFYINSKRFAVVKDGEITQIHNFEDMGRPFVKLSKIENNCITETIKTF